MLASLFVVAATASAAEQGPRRDAALNTAALPPGTAPIGREAPLPRILSQADAQRYQRIFALQEDGKWRAADREIGRLRDRLLMGHVLAQRYLHPTAYRSRFGVLKRWLARYADHPDARRIYRLAMKRKPARARAPKRPVAPVVAAAVLEEIGVMASAGGEVRSVEPLPRNKISRQKRRRLSALTREIRVRIRRGWPTGARKVLRTREFAALASEAEFDAARAAIAASYYAHGKDKLAFALAARSAERSGRWVPVAYWTAGLAAWRLGDMDGARRHFEALAESPSAPSWLVSAGAYWAARVRLVTRQPELVNRFLAIAADHPRTFYGLLAMRALGQKPRFKWEPAPLTDHDLAIALRVPGIKRAIALAEVGQARRAEAELRRLYPRATPAVVRLLLPLASRLHLPALEMAVAQRLAELDGRRHDGALFPLPRWAPPGGFSVDRALVFALIRQESKFRPQARSPRGARGVMQLMPRTAAFAARNAGIERPSRARLYVPETNIALGQAYIRHLLGYERVGRNLFFLTAAYNSGPAKLDRWLRKVDFNRDPLLFIESVPSKETRLFIERVMTNYWIYRMRLGQPTPSLDAVAAGRWPLYVAQEDHRFKVARDAEDR